MSLLLTLDAPAVGGVFPVDPATLNPDEHYNELGNNSPAGDWSCNITNAVFDNKTVGITATTYNSLKSWISNGVNNVFSSASSTPRALQYADTDTWLTFFFIMSFEIGGAASKYPFQFIGAGGASGSFCNYGADGKFNFFCRDASARSAAQVWDEDVRDGIPRVYAWRVKNVTNDHIADLWCNGVKNSTATANPWTAQEHTGNAMIYNLVAASLGSHQKWCELIFWKSALTDLEIENISLFLVNKWTV